MHQGLQSLNEALILQHVIAGYP